MGKNLRSKKNQPTPAKKIDPAIVIAIIGLTGTLVTAIFASPVLIAWIQKPVSPTSIPTNATSYATPTSSQILENQDWTSIIRMSLRNNQCDDPRVLPISIRPAENASQAANDFAEAGKSDTYLDWPLAPLGADGRGEITIEVSSVGSNDEWIKITNQLNIEIVAQKDLPEHMDVVNFAQCGGTRDRRVFDEIFLSTDFNEYKLSSTFSETDIFTLQPGEFEEFVLPIVCKTPGAYVLKTNLLFKYIQTEYITDSQQIAIFICPPSFTLWKVDLNYPQFLSSESYQWNGTNYQVE